MKKYWSPKLYLPLIYVFTIFPFKNVLGQETIVDTSRNIITTNISTAKKIADTLIEFMVKYSFQVLGGIIVLAVGYIISKVAARSLSQYLDERKVDPTIIKFLAQILKITIFVFTLLIALGNFGITIAPFIAGISVAGFGLSFALQGPLSNYAAGATLIFTKPFKVGDIIEVTGVIGEVEDMTLARTQISTVDSTKIVIPNKQIIGEIIHNYSILKKIDIKIGISYSANIQKAISIISEVIKSDKRIAQIPESKTGIHEFGDSSINICARIWCKQADYWDVLFSINKEIYDGLKNENIQIPFPQRDVHIYNEKV